MSKQKEKSFYKHAEWTVKNISKEMNFYTIKLEGIHREYRFKNWGRDSWYVSFSYGNLG